MIKFFSLLLIASLLTSLVVFAQPSFDAGSDITVNQNSGLYPATVWATNINAVDPSFEVEVLNVTDDLQFTTSPSIDAAGNLTFEPKLNHSGIATVSVALRDLSTNELSTINATFKINVSFINSPPSFVVPVPDQIIDEKAGAQTVLQWATSISPGPNPIENTQDVNFTTTVVSKTTYINFITLPSVNKSGALTYELEENSNGTATVEVFLTDDGSNTTPNSNVSTTITFTITVNPINDPPSFTIGDNIHIDEHTGMVSMPNWATNITAGAPDEDASQTINFIINEKSITSYLQYDVPVSVTADGTLSFQATPHYNGVAVYEIYLVDDGPSDSPNDNTSPLQGFTVSVDFINDAPSFTIGNDIVIDEGDDTYTFSDWATDISPGGSPNEQDQKLLFTVAFQQVTGSLAFLRAPEIDDTGLLIFRPTQHTHGEAIFDVYLTDDGDFDPPNENQSPAQSFKITVNKVNYPPNDLILSNTNILEKQAAGSFVGQFTTADLDPEDTHDYALVPGEGADDNDSFFLDGDNLLSNEVFDWKTKNSYTIRVKTSDGEFGLEKSFNINIEKLVEGIKFANAITPNGDGENDTWELEDIESFPNATVDIFDTAGQPVYKSRQGYTPWDGTFNGRILPMGTYYYVIDLHDGINVYKGTLTIIL